MSKKASASGGDIVKFIFWFGMEFIVLGIYAVLWQQMIKRFDLSVAYANRSMAVVWSMIWAIVFFHDTITLNNIIGVCLVVVGTLIINGEGVQTKDD
jgi:drug/metabolite transporter (DMT)-like permease